MDQNKLKYAVIVILFLLIILFIAKIVKKIIKFKQINYNDYIVLKLVIPNSVDSGGFAWHLHHVQCLIYLCELTNKKPIVYFNGGYYGPKNSTQNWWTNYFQPIGDPNVVKKIVNYGDKNGYQKIRKLPLIATTVPYLYDNVTFQRVARKINIDFVKMYQKITLNRKMQKKIEKYRKKIQNYYMIGIHYRGTDKFASFQDNEDLKENKHYKYEEVIHFLKKHIATHHQKKIAIFVASDEQPFVDEISRNFDTVFNYQSSRSDLSTSGLSLNTKHCVADSTDPDCIKLKEIQEKSVHRGLKNISPYKKGEDAVMDIWLLASCQEVIRTHQGNFSGQPQRINPSLIVYSL